MNQAVELYQARPPQTAASLRMQVNLIQEVMAAVMKDGTHYGTIPGTPKPSLWKPGAEVLGATFHIASSYRTEDLSGDSFIRYRVVCIGTHQGTGTVMGEGLGECSSLEEKYKWRKATGQKEFDNTPEDRRRVKYGKDYTVNQVRTECVDQANTILKMAAKRAQVAMILNVVAASDIFTQDIEDIPEELREAGAAESTKKAPVRKPAAKKGADKADQQPGQQQQAAAAPNAPLSDGQKRILRARMESAQITDEQVTKKFGAALDALQAAKFNDLAAWMREMAEATA